MSNFFFSHSVFKRLVLQTRQNQGLFGKGLKLNHEHLNSSSYVKNLDFCNSKAFADHSFKMTEIVEILIDMVENIVENKFWLPVFSPFPAMFSEAFFLGVFKSFALSQMTF